MAYVKYPYGVDVNIAAHGNIYNNKNKARGPISLVIYGDWNSGNGPCLQFADTIVGYGIRQMEFKPVNVDMTWDPITKDLTIAGTSFNFSIKIDRIKKPRAKKQ